MPCPFSRLLEPEKEEQEEDARKERPFRGAEFAEEAFEHEEVGEQVRVLARSMEAPPLGAFFRALSEQMGGVTDARAEEFFRQFESFEGAMFPRFSAQFLHGVSRRAGVKSPAGLQRVEDAGARSIRQAINEATGHGARQGGRGFKFDAGRTLRDLFTGVRRRLSDGSGPGGFPFSARQ